MEAGSGEKVEEFVVLHQDPSPSEAISPRVARPYIQALHSINLDSPPAEQEEKGGGAEEDMEKETQAKEEPAQIEELIAVMDQVTDTFFICLFEIANQKAIECNIDGWIDVYIDGLIDALVANVSFTNTPLPRHQLTPIERYALHYLEYLHVGDDESAFKVTDAQN